MSKPSVSAALKRLSKPTHAYLLDDKHSQRTDIETVCAALRLVDECADHMDDADGQPIYTVRLPCDWRIAQKGFLACLTASRGRGRDDVG